MTAYPPLEPYDSGLLEVGDGNQIYWETCGSPDGVAVLNVHGGPGAGTSHGPRRGFDPQRCRIICFDQRGCGRSLPHAADPATDMSVNTTEHLLADMERLREHLGVERWMLHGGSWGSTLILAYAERHPERVSAIVLLGVTTTRRSEIDWLYHGVARFAPRAWKDFVDAVPEALAPPNPWTGDITPVLRAYARRLDSPDPVQRLEAAHAWLTWEDAIIALEPNHRPGNYSDQPDADAIAFVRICATYFAHAAWLEEGALLRDVDRLAGIPAALLHGAFDLGSPVHVAHELHDRWPGSRLIIIEDSGHTGSATYAARLHEEIERILG